MHPNLAPHLHNEECRKIIEQLHKCHAESKFGKFWGACNETRRALDRCLQREYLANRKENWLKSEEKKKKIADRIEKDSQPDSN